MSSIRDLFSIYIIIIMLIIGAYMLFWQSKYLKTVDHLEKEALFVKIMGGIYLVVGVIGIFIVMV